MTYAWTLQGWLYLAILLDLGARAIVGWATSSHCDTDLCLLALERTVARTGARSLRGLMHHTDRGSTYTATRYRDRKKGLGLVVSQSRKGAC
jgi:transposase InsO family protein